MESNDLTALFPTTVRGLSRRVQAVQTMYCGNLIQHIQIWDMSSSHFRQNSKLNLDSLLQTKLKATRGS